MNPRCRPWLWLAATLSLCLLPIGSARGQISSDGSLSTNVNSVDNANFTIDGGNRVGGNLFHSFGEFSVPTGGSAIFNNATDVNNIIGRVTGDSISNIDGLLGANGAANLFLLNPNGIIFGANSSLDIGGSLISSTAEAIVFADGTNYRARASRQEPPLLTVSVPMGLQFGANPEAIVNRSIANPDPSLAGRPMGLQVESGRTLALVGGEVALEGGNITPGGGRVELGSVGGNSLVGLKPTNGGFALDYAGVENFQDVRLSQGATVDVTNFDPLAGSGDVRVQGRQIIVSEGSQIASFTTGVVSSGSIELRASESVELIGTGTRQGSSFPSPSNLTTNTIGDGNAGDLSITTKRLIIRDGAGIFTNSVRFGMQNPLGRAGNLRIMASELVELRGRDPSFGPSRLSVETRSNGAAGDLQITTRQLLVEDGAEVTAATSEAAGRGGTIEIVASESVELAGIGIDSEGEVVPSRLTASSEGAGDAGNLTVSTNTLTVRDGAEIGVSGTGTGAAGNLEIQASLASLDNNGMLRSETTAGDRGSIELNVGDILLRRNSSITTEATGTASGGNITIDTTTLAALEDSDITANAILGSGGNIFIRTRGLFLSPESEITASSQFGVSGTVEIVNPETDPASGLLELPSNLEDLTNQIGAICAATKEESSFIVTGRGGIPSDPTSTLRGRVIWRDLQDFSSEDVSPEILQSSSRQSRSLLASSLQEAIAPDLAPESAPQLVEATGWKQAADGTIELVASIPDFSGGLWHRSAKCSDLLDRPSNPPQVLQSDRPQTEQSIYTQ